MVKMRIMLDSAKFSFGKCDNESDYSFRRSMKELIGIVLVKQNYFKAAGRGLYVLEDVEYTPFVDKKVMLDLEDIRLKTGVTIIDMLKVCTIERNGVVVDLLDWYMKNRKPYYLEVVVPQLKAEAEERKRRFLERIKQMKEKKE